MSQSTKPTACPRNRSLAPGRDTLGRARDEIGDHAFHRLEEEFDWVEMGIGKPG